MATDIQDLHESVSQLLSRQEQLLAKVASLQRPEGKDLWDKLGALSGLLIAIVGGLFSYLYSYHQAQQADISQKHQTKLEEIQTVGTFMPYLVGKDDAAKSIALSEVENLLDAQTAVLIAEHVNSAQTSAGNANPDPVVVRFLQHMAENGKTQVTKSLAAGALARIRAAEAPDKR